MGTIIFLLIILIIEFLIGIKVCKKMFRKNENTTNKLKKEEDNEVIIENSNSMSRKNEKNIKL